MKNRTNLTITISGTSPEGEVIHQRYENVAGVEMCVTGGFLPQPDGGIGAAVELALFGAAVDCTFALANLIVDAMERGHLGAALEMARRLTNGEGCSLVAEGVVPLASDKASDLARPRQSDDPFDLLRRQRGEREA